MKNLALKRQLAAFARGYQVRVIYRGNESIHSASSNKHAREIAAWHVKRGATAHVELVLK
jgi:hypothetical protein